MKRLMLLLGCAVFLTACADGDAGDPAVAVEDYLQAKVKGDTEAIRGLLCADMEAVLERETRTFESVSGVDIEGMSCQLEEGSEDRVRCQGKIVAVYGTEQTEFPLTSYRVVQEDGQWKWCGEAP